MKRALGKFIVVLLLTAMTLALFTLDVAYASGSLQLEKSHEWITGSRSYVNDVSVGDIDGDGVVEIITVGYYHNSTASPEYDRGEAILWNWNGTEIVLEYAAYDPFTFSTQYNAIDFGYIDEEEDIDIVVAGSANIPFIVSGPGPPSIVYQTQGMLIAGSWNGSVLTPKAFTYWPGDRNLKAIAFDVAVCDVDNDGVTEIVTVGYQNTTYPENGFKGQIRIWNITHSEFMLEQSFEYWLGAPAEWHGISADDVDNDGQIELVAGGFATHLNMKIAMLMIFSWNGTNLELEKRHQWYTINDTRVSSVATTDIDKDGVTEILTGGFYSDGLAAYGQLRVWSWDGDYLLLKASREWGSGNYLSYEGVSAIATGDVDGDGEIEVVTGGFSGVLMWSSGQIRVWSWNNNMLVLEAVNVWGDANAVYGIAVDDVDNDGIVETVTGGQKAIFMTVEIMSELGIWSVSKVVSSLTLTLSSSNIMIGESVRITGVLTNEAGDTPIPNAEITLEYSIDPMPTPVHLATVKTNENGEYTYTWEPPEPGTYIIIANWKGDFEHGGASATARLTVEKAPSLVVLSLSSYTAKVGEAVNVNGTLYPAKATQITIEYTMPNGTIITKTVDSNSAGMFSDNFTVDQAGVWNVKASWDGDDVYKGAESFSTSLSVSKIQSTLSISASSLTINVGENITISGTLTPAQTATVTITYTMPNGTTITKSIVTPSTGAFTDTIKLNQAGAWQIKASWSGNERYEASISDPLTVAAQAVDYTTPILAAASLALCIIALLLAAIGFAAIRRKTGTQPPAPPPPPEAPPTTQT